MEMRRKFKEYLSIKLAKNPENVVLAGIIAFNVILLFLAAFVISRLSLTGTEGMGFWQAAFYTVTMILDAGCISFVVEDVGAAGVVLSIFCLVVVILGMVSFTGAVIGYITNYISDFISNANDGNRKLYLDKHIVILNWNTRASEIVNDLLYCEGKQKVVILVNSRKDEINKEIHERIADTISRENQELLKSLEGEGWWSKWKKFHKNCLRHNVTYIIREGDIFSSKQLRDISLERAASVIILGSDFNNSVCKYETAERVEGQRKGNPQTIKTLMQVADITSADYSADDQKIIVEITDDWTEALVDQIIKAKRVAGKCNIVPVKVNVILGQLLSQFSIMPELNLVYKELFSNKGAAFYSKEHAVISEEKDILKYLETHKHAIPLTSMTDSDGKPFCFYASGGENDIDTVSRVKKSDYKVELVKDFWLEPRSVIILGHNSKSRDIMRGFDAFRCEWTNKDSNEEILRIIVIDDPKSLEKYNYYREYPFVVDTVPADAFDRERIYAAIDAFVDTNPYDTSVLILSDDLVPSDDIDANALTNLVYLQDIINRKVEENPKFDTGSIDVIVEIIDPKHYDLVSSYSVNNVVISNRFISKMVTQIGEKEALFDFYTDILTYDTDVEEGYDSKEIYTKKVTRFFESIPGPCTAEQLIRAVYKASIDEKLDPAHRNPTIALGYVKSNGKMVLFEGDQSSIKVNLEAGDKLIVFSNH